MATMHSRCYFSITIHGNDAVTVVYSSQHLVSFGGPMNTQLQCMQYSFHNCMLARTLAIFMALWMCLCHSRGGNMAIFMYYWLDSGK